MKKHIISNGDLASSKAIVRIWSWMLCALFPEWTAAGDWRLALATFLDRGHVAFVDVAAKTVFFNRPWIGLDAVMVHVMCHAGTESEGHGRRWYERMKEAADRLRSIGQDMAALMVDHNADLEFGTSGGSRELVMWHRPVLEIRVDAKGRVKLVPYVNEIETASRAGQASNK